MPELLRSIFIWTIKISFILACVFASIVLINIALSMIYISLNQNVLQDIFALVQIWLPFNLSVVLSWFTAATISYLMYRLALLALGFVNRLLDNA